MNSTSIRRRAILALLGVCSLGLAALLAGCGQNAKSPQTVAQADAEKPSQVASAAAETKEAPTDTTLTLVAENATQVTSCSGDKTVTVAKDLTGQPLADELMSQWTIDHPGRDWVAEEKQRHAFQPPADNSDLLQGEQGKGHSYGNYTERDLLTWARETEKLVAEGSRVFHDADALGSTVAVSCDMCHPDASNTHPETYPKFQTQMGRVAMLRDMIDWCVENPVRGNHLEPDSPTMRALEAYIMAQRKGVQMNYGKH